MFYTRTDEDGGAERRLLLELDEIDELRIATMRCEEDNYSEPAWNDEVHGRFLRLALKGCADVRHNNVTTARVVPSLLPRHVSGDLFKSKMVDYTINLLPNREMMKAMICLLRDQSYDLQTINQTRADPIRFVPIAISIETKTPKASKQEASIQLGMWVAAYFNRIRTLTHASAVMPMLPLLYVVGARWCLRFARDFPEQIEIIGNLDLGNTHSVLGCYKLLASLRCLCKWVVTTFIDWFEVNVLQACSTE